MKRKITLEIDIDTSEPGVTGFRGVNDSLFRISVRRDVIDDKMINDTPQEIGIAMAHELGHFVGYLCDFPATRREPRPLFSPGIIFSSLDTESRILRSEQEAWDIGYLMLRASEVRNHGIKSYLRGMRYLRHESEIIG